MRRLIPVLCLAGVLVPGGTAAAATHALGSKRERIHPVAHTGTPLPERLLLRPGYYRTGGRVYDMREAGYYVLGRRQRRIVAGEGAYGLLSGVAWSASETGLDDRHPPNGPKMARLAMLRRPSLSCGYVVELARYLLAQRGVISRAVGSVGRNPATTHTMLEALIRGRWILYDPYHGVQPLHRGRPLSLVRWERRNGLLLRPLSADYPLTPKELIRTPGYRAIFGTPLISLPSLAWVFYFTGPDRERISSYSETYRYLPRDQFYRRFYPRGTAGP